MYTMKFLFEIKYLILSYYTYYLIFFIFTGASSFSIIPEGCITTDGTGNAITTSCASG